MTLQTTYKFLRNTHIRTLMDMHLNWKYKSKMNKSSAVAEMGDHGHNRHGPKRGGCCAPFTWAGPHL